jgi:hypothetical protein
MSTAMEIVQAVEANGGRLTVEGEWLVVYPREVGKTLGEELRQHKAEIIGLLESAPMSAPLTPEPIQDPAKWRDPFSRWIVSACVGHWRLHGGVGRLHVAFCESEVGRGAVPCSRADFEALLREQGWEIEQPLALVNGLMLRVDVDARLLPENAARSPSKSPQFSQGRELCA